LQQRAGNAGLRDAYLQAGAPAWAADFLCRRLDRFVPWDVLTAPRLSDVPDPSGIPSMDSAVRRIVTAVHNKERIALACDHDMDGTASAALLWTALVEHFHLP
jgi:single-stranded-DNA-specific exonuclease